VCIGDSDADVRFGLFHQTLADDGATATFLLIADRPGLSLMPLRWTVIGRRMIGWGGQGGHPRQHAESYRPQCCHTGKANEFAFAMASVRYPGGKSRGTPARGLTRTARIFWPNCATAPLHVGCQLEGPAWIRRGLCCGVSPLSVKGQSPMRADTVVSMFCLLGRGHIAFTISLNSADKSLPAGFRFRFVIGPAGTRLNA